MLKWRGVWEGLGAFTWADGRKYDGEYRKLPPRAGTDSSRVPASWEEQWCQFESSSFLLKKYY